jgi:hypothetical protein
MTGHEGDRRACSSVRHWYSGISGSRNPGRHARHNLDCNAMGNQMGCFFSTTAKQEGISTF